ncbi:hypothetical protein [Streptomyces silaceus]|uniref:hypothetical protein n=1 Tax=Streptomyces silaceus TaxID=545123 RepID=UPI0006EBB49A|nr:hypothetical protein [Streptomyces silaceus]
MTVLVCSLKTSEPQRIEPGAYRVVRFPFGAAESHDVHTMHQVVQPDGVRLADWIRDDRSGLIWPAAEGWGTLHALIQWEDGEYTEVRSQFVRDPLGLSTGPDSTCTEDDVPTPGGQFRAKTWGLFVHPGTPLALVVRHDARTAQRVTLAEFKLAIHPTEV